MNWHPIESAPADELILVFGDGVIHVARIWSDGDAVVGDDIYYIFDRPTHWMPLPDPPKEQP